MGMEDLAKAIFEAQSHTYLGDTFEVSREPCMSAARAALDFLHITPEAAKRGVNVGKAVEALRAECGRCEVKSLCCTCSGGEALHFLGEDLKREMG